MYSEVLHYYVHNKTNPTQTREGRARRILIKTKIISPAPTQNAEDRAIVLGASTPLSPPPPPPRRFPVLVVIAATSPCHPWPSCSPFPPRAQLPATAVGGPVVVVVVMAVLVLAFPWSSWSSQSWGCWVVACRSVVIFLPVVVVVVRVPVSSFGRTAPRLHPASSCSQRRLAFVVLSFHPRSILQTVTSSGSVVSAPH